MEYGSRSQSDEAPLSDSEDRDHTAHDSDGMGETGMELSGQVMRPFVLGSTVVFWWTQKKCRKHKPAKMVSS